VRVDFRSAASCRQAAPALAAMVDGPGAVGRPVSRHVSSCLRCQAELAGYRRTRRLLRQLQHPAELDPPDAAPTPGTAAVVLLLPGADADRVSISAGRRFALMGGIAAATIAAATTVTVVGRGRMVRTARAS
jgi:anti-sigma factor RsiW